MASSGLSWTYSSSYDLIRPDNGLVMSQVKCWLFLIFLPLKLISYLFSLMDRMIIHLSGPNMSMFSQSMYSAFLWSFCFKILLLDALFFGRDLCL
jgi:hypothetical protein